MYSFIEYLSKYLANYTIVDTYTKILTKYDSSYSMDYQWYDANLMAIINNTNAKYLSVACT